MGRSEAGEAWGGGGAGVDRPGPLQELLHEDQVVDVVAELAVDADHGAVGGLDEQVHLAAALGPQAGFELAEQPGELVAHGLPPEGETARPPERDQGVDVAGGRVAKSRPAHHRKGYRRLAVTPVVTMPGRSWSTLRPRGKHLERAGGRSAMRQDMRTGDPADASGGALAGAAAAALAGWRRGLVGLVALSLLFIDVTAFMLPAAVSNAGAGETLGGVALPASLAALSLTCLTAAVAAVALGVRRRRATAGAGAGRGPAVLAAGAAAALAIALGAVAVAGPSRASAANGSQRLALQAASTKFSTTLLEAHPGRVTVSLANRDLFWHTFTIERLGANVDVPVGGTRSVTFTVAPGTYTFTCTVPGHASAGMRGTLAVR